MEQDDIKYLILYKLPILEKKKQFHEVITLCRINDGFNEFYYKSRFCICIH